MPTFATDIVSAVASTTVTFVLAFIHTYFVYLLSFGVISLLVGAFTKKLRMW